MDHDDFKEVKDLLVNIFNREYNDTRQVEISHATSMKKVQAIKLAWAQLGMKTDCSIFSKTMHEELVRVTTSIDENFTLTCTGLEPVKIIYKKSQIELSKLKDWQHVLNWQSYVDKDMK